jgi:REP element-mobilizing transposase RayT
MGRRIRYVPEGGGLFMVTCRTIHGRLLFRPSPELNEIFVGVLARAQRRYGVSVSSVVCLSNHYHLTLRVDSSLRLARFMGFLNSNLGREIGRLRQWPDKVFSRRYQATLISDEEAAQVERLKYILSHGCKEDLVERPGDWPGVHCVEALTQGTPLTGYWFDRTQEFAARRRRENYDRLRYATLETLVFDPLPCWSHLCPEQYRQRILALVAEIEEEAFLRRSRTGTRPLGREGVLSAGRAPSSRQDQEIARALRPRREPGGPPPTLGGLRLVRSFLSRRCRAPPCRKPGRPLPCRLLPTGPALRRRVITLSPVPELLAAEPNEEKNSSRASGLKRVGEGLPECLR